MRVTWGRIALFGTVLARAPSRPFIYLHTGYLVLDWVIDHVRREMVARLI